MTGVQPSAKDNGIVENVLGTLAGLALFGGGIAIRLTVRSAPDLLVLIFTGIGLVLTAMAAHETWKTVQDLKAAGVTHPVEVLKADLNDRDRILKDVGTLVLFWVVAGAVGTFGFSTPAEASRLLVETVRTSPELVAGWFVVNAIFVIAAMFSSYRGGTNAGGAM